MRTAAIIQARIGSSRLPGKVLMDLGGKTTLWHVLTRSAAVSGVDIVCCATTDNPADDIVADAAREAGATVFRGSENDVLGRYAMAARHLDAAIVLRLTADCPLLDPAVCGDVLALRAAQNADFACNNLPPSWPHGLDCEVFTREWLDCADAKARNPYEREHVGPWVRNHPNARKVNLPCPEAGLAGLRWTLDTAADYSHLKALFEKLPSGPGAWSWRVPLALERAKPAMEVS